MRRILGFAVPVIFLAGIFAAPAGQFWEKKEYKQWSQKECAKLLEDSPWAEELNLVQTSINPSNLDSDDGQAFYIKYQIQFRSALPIRQALVRQMQIAQKYDKLPPEQKQQFDKSAEGFLNADFSDKVIVYVYYSTNSRNRDLELARYWQSQTMDLLKNSVFLSNSKGNKVSLIGFNVAPGAERSFQFIFPREYDGEPLIGMKDKSLKLEWTYPVINRLGDGRGFTEFKPEKMVFQGNFAY